MKPNEQYYKIAGLKVRMDTFDRTRVHGRPYEIEPTEPDLVVDPDRDAVRERFPDMSEGDCEYFATGQTFYRKLLQFDGMLLHSSAVAVDGRGYLFTAMPGTGKSTHTALWRRVLGDDRVRLFNDDKPALRWEDGRFYAYGTPWSGKTDLNLNIRVPLAGICVLCRGEENRIERFGGMDALVTLMEQTLRPQDAKGRERLMSLMDRLLTHVPVWKMHCNMKPDAAWMSYTTMSGCGKEE